MRWPFWAKGGFSHARNCFRHAEDAISTRGEGLSLAFGPDCGVEIAICAMPVKPSGVAQMMLIGCRERLFAPGPTHVLQFRSARCAFVD